MNKNQTLLDPALRSVVPLNGLAMRPYDRYGEARTDMAWLPLAGGTDDGFECFLLRFSPGAASMPHEHCGREQFLVLEGELTDCDGAVFRAGELVTFEPGSRHYSISPQGCTLLVVLHGRNRALFPEK